VTCVFFHAHPDDEVLLTGGTMARLAAAGRRVVLVIATMGERGLTAGDGHPDGVALGRLRMRELAVSAAGLGCARVLWLGYRDSGSGPSPPPPGDSFAAADVDDAAARLASVLSLEAAELLTIYDPAGGYGHLDHVQVHRVGLRAAELAGTPHVWEATVDRDLLLRAARLVSRWPGITFDPAPLAQMYVAGADITHRVNVRRFARAKHRAMAAHATQRRGSETRRLLDVLVSLPHPVFRLALGTEWFVDNPTDIRRDSLSLDSLIQRHE
jgi:LmbE family N-acetylglucosaminyl deacetylase